jgi:hypothetical protein
VYFGWWRVGLALWTAVRSLVAAGQQSDAARAAKRQPAATALRARRPDSAIPRRRP